MSISARRSQGDPVPYPIPCKTCPATGPNGPSPPPPPPARPPPPPPAPLPISPASSGRRTAGEWRRCTASDLRTAPPTPAPTATLPAPRTTPAGASPWRRHSRGEAVLGPRRRRRRYRSERPLQAVRLQNTVLNILRRYHDEH